MVAGVTWQGGGRGWEVEMGGFRLHLRAEGDGVVVIVAVLVHHAPAEVKEATHISLYRGRFAKAENNRARLRVCPGYAGRPAQILPTLPQA